MDVANNIVPDDFLNLRPADYETRLASPEPHLYSMVNHCFHDLLEQCGIGHTGRRLRMYDLRHTRTAFPGSLRNTVLPVHNRTAFPGSLRNTVHPWT